MLYTCSLERMDLEGEGRGGCVPKCVPAVLATLRCWLRAKQRLCTPNHFDADAALWPPWASIADPIWHLMHFVGTMSIPHCVRLWRDNHALFDMPKTCQTQTLNIPLPTTLDAIDSTSSWQSPPLLSKRQDFSSHYLCMALLAGYLCLPRTAGRRPTVVMTIPNLCPSPSSSDKPLAVTTSATNHMIIFLIMSIYTTT